MEIQPKLGPVNNAAVVKSETNPNTKLKRFENNKGHKLVQT